MDINRWDRGVWAIFIVGLGVKADFLLRVYN